MIKLIQTPAPDTNTQNKKWNIDKIEFKNMLIYGNNKLNTIDFVKLW